MGKFTRDDVDKFCDYDIYIPTRTLYMGPAEVSIEHGVSEVDEAMAERVIKGLHILDNTNHDPINVILNTQGGSVVQGFAIYDAIKSCKSHVTVKAIGECSSMGTVIIQAADKRIVAPHVTFMIHVGTTSAPQDHVKNVKNAMRWDDKLDEFVNNIYMARIQEKNPTFTKAQLSTKLLFDNYLTAQEAIDLGLADKILGEDDE